MLGRDGEGVSNEGEELLCVFLPVLGILGDGAPSLAVMRLGRNTPLPHRLLLSLRDRETERQRERERERDREMIELSTVEPL